MTTAAPVNHGPEAIELVSGEYLDLTLPDPKAITLDTIAFGLSQTGRYTGQTPRFYSVAEHAMLVAERLAMRRYSARIQLLGLHHDDAEAFTGDLTRPLQQAIGTAATEALLRVQRRLDAAIDTALNLPHLPGYDWRDAVKAADDWALSAESYHLMPSRGRGWFCEGIYRPAGEQPVALESLGLSPDDAREGWLAMHHRLVGDVIRSGE